MATLILMVSGCSFNTGNFSNRLRAFLHCRAFSQAESTEFTVITDIFLALSAPHSSDVCMFEKSESAISHCRPFSQAKMAAFSAAEFGTTRPQTLHDKKNVGLLHATEPNAYVHKCTKRF